MQRLYGIYCIDLLSMGFCIVGIYFLYLYFRFSCRDAPRGASLQEIEPTRLRIANVHIRFVLTTNFIKIYFYNSFSIFIFNFWVTISVVSQGRDAPRGASLQVTTSNLFLTCVFQHSINLIFPSINTYDSQPFDSSCSIWVSILCNRIIILCWILPF